MLIPWRVLLIIGGGFKDFSNFVSLFLLGMMFFHFALAPSKTNISL